MKYIRESKVLYGDTDSYKVVWHGSYLRWFEQGRFFLCEQIGIDIIGLDKQGITFPIVDLHVRYKSPAQIFEDIIIETSIQEVNRRTVIFNQSIKNKETGKVHVTADVVCVAVSSEELKMTKISDEMLEKFANAIEEEVS